MVATEKREQDQRRDEVLTRLLKTPPKPKASGEKRAETEDKQSTDDK
jgi:hypothetical protein